MAARLPSLLATTALAITVGVGAVQLHQQNVRLDRLARELSAARAQTARTLAALDERPEAPPCAARATVTAQGISPADVDAIAARVVALGQTQARTDSLVATEAKAPTPDRLATRADVQQRIDAMIASGRARRDDVLALRREIADDGEERSEVARQIAVAMNAGKLTPEDPRTLVP